MSALTQCLAATFNGVTGVVTVTANTAVKAVKYGGNTIAHSLQATDAMSRDFAFEAIADFVGISKADIKTEAGKQAIREMYALHDEITELTMK